MFPALGHSQRVVSLVAALALLVGCASTRPASPTTAPAATSAAEAPTRQAAAATSQGRCRDLPPETTTPARSPADTGEDAEPRAPSSGETEPEPTVPISYDQASNTISLSNAAPMTLPAIARSLGRADLLAETSPGEWLLSANLRVGKSAILHIAGPDVRRLKLRSDASGFVWIKAIGGQLAFVDTCVTSWDAGRGAVDENPDDGRSFVLARDGARMDIRDSELSYLGYYAAESYGVAWRLAGTSGEVTGSRFGHNFYGLYSYAVSGLVIRGNEVHHSVRYGIDPHTRSNGLLIEDNRSHHNGKQGIILAEECDDGVVRGNTVYANALHGIVIYQRSNNNLVEGNTSYDNALQGINVNDSSGNTIRGNTVYGNGDAGIGVGQGAANNQVIGNTARDNLRDGIYLFSAATGNTLSENTVTGNTRYGIYVKSPSNIIGADNRVSGNKAGDIQTKDEG